MTVENCDPFGCKKVTSIDHNAINDLKKTEPLGKFVGLDIYFDRGHLAIENLKCCGKRRIIFSNFLKLYLTYHLQQFFIRLHLPSLL